MSIGGQFADARKKELAEKSKLVFRIDTGIEFVRGIAASPGGDE